MGTSSATAPRAGRHRARLLLMLAGVAAIVSGLVLVAIPLLGVWQRGGADQSALNGWNNGGSNALAGAPKEAGLASKTSPCGSGSPSDYALVSFGAPASEHYAGVASDGTWDDLTRRSMVHYAGTAAPGQVGNSIIAFHREPDFEHIDQLNVGDTVTVQDRACKTWIYRVTGRWVLAPNAVTQLVPTTGHDLTLVTCTPFWVDTQRIIWRATLQPSGS